VEDATHVSYHTLCQICKGPNALLEYHRHAPVWIRKLIPDISARDAQLVKFKTLATQPHASDQLAQGNTKSCLHMMHKVVQHARFAHNHIKCQTNPELHAFLECK
jgi:hypothetical protein